jgi:hypothetical protein
MTAGELIEIFRSEMRGYSLEVLRDDELLRYLDESYRMFVRLSGGIPDSNSDVTTVQIVAGEPYATLDSSILRILRAELSSDGEQITVINQTDLPKLNSRDYGAFNQLTLKTTGKVRYMLIGSKPNTVRWLGIPTVDDSVDLTVYRLPLVTVDSIEHQLDEIDDQNHLALVDRLKFHVFKRPGTSFFNLQLAQAFDGAFRTACQLANAEQDRYKFKPRTVGYGGI